MTSGFLCSEFVNKNQLSTEQVISHDLLLCKLAIEICYNLNVLLKFLILSPFECKNTF